MDFKFIEQLSKPSDTKIVLIVMDGLGGIPDKTNRVTELKAAKKTNLNALAVTGICGLHQPVGVGITPGSGPSHLALFGYDPIQYQIGRGALEALGVDFEIESHDIAARGNFCTVDRNGKIVDRRAGRISTEECAELCKVLAKIESSETEFFVEPVSDYRFLLVLRGQKLSPSIGDTDPQKTGAKPLDPEPLLPEAEKTCMLLTNFIEQASRLLVDFHPANMVLLRGFSRRPNWWPRMDTTFNLKPAAISGYPMYRGLAKLLGMEILEAGESTADQFSILEKRWSEFDFFYVHIKEIDSAGEDGDFDRKVSLIEEVDANLERLFALKPDVIVVTGDHSTPTCMRSHSWHPVPLLFWSEYCRPDQVDRFDEEACTHGMLGPNFPAKDLMPLMMANALRLKKFGA
jgi:2,3-bisphosphoglycerate-independent phosphoglycerate mutase